MTRSETLRVSKIFQSFGNHETSILLAIPNTGFTFPGQIVRDIDFIAVGVSLALIRMEKRGLVIRKKHVADSRKIEVYLTKAGKKLQTSIIAKLQATIKLMTDRDDLLDRIKSARDKLSKLKATECRCSSLVLQYEGRCCCGRGTSIKNATQELDKVLMEIGHGN